jgi:serine/threonine protein kinase
LPPIMSVHQAAIDLDDVTTQELSKGAFLELYSVDKPLGQGAFGAVMKGTTLSTGEAVAMKMIDKQQADKVNEEIRIWAKIRHHACVRLLAVYDLSAYMALVTEFCEGGTLLDRLATAKDFMAEHQAQRLACELLCALLHLHEIGVAHRDVKPDNVLCTLPTGAAAVEHMHVKLADFGLSATFEPAHGHAAFHGVVGTAEYMAPERVREWQRLRAGAPAGPGREEPEAAPRASHDERVDWWAAGCLIYELLAGRSAGFQMQRAPERCLSSLEAHRGLRGSGQLAPRRQRVYPFHQQAGRPSIRRASRCSSRRFSTPRSSSRRSPSRGSAPRRRS